MSGAAEATADGIAEAVLRHYASLPRRGKPNIPNEWTVLAGIVLENLAEQTLSVVAMATGTKCMGFTQLSERGDVLHDSHAEVLARRAFQRYLYCQIEHAASGRPSILVLEATHRRFALRRSETHESMFRIHLYISQAPCGDACIFDENISGTLQREDKDLFKRAKGSGEAEACTREHTVESLSPPRKKGALDMVDDDDSAGANPAPPVKDVHRTGAKPVHAGPQDALLPGAAYHTRGVLRTKPGRGIPTRSMSCTDKIAKWTVVGLQGALLGLFLEPLYLDSVVVGELYDRAAMTRALHERLSPLDASAVPAPYSHRPPSLLRTDKHLFESSKPRVELALIDLRSKDAAKVPRLAAAGTSICWHAGGDEPHADYAVLGKRQGYNAKRTADPELGKHSLCKRSMLERFTEITSQLQASEHCRLLVPEKLQQCLEESPTYLKLKRLSGNYQNAKSQFTDLFCTWLGNGNTGQEFDVPRKP